MPELPEVETTVRYLRSHILDKAISAVTYQPGSARHFNKPLDEVSSLLAGARLASLDRVGKWMLFQFQNAGTDIFAVGHLRMSGKYLVTDAVYKHVHNRFQLQFANGTFANYIDQRRFGTFHFVDGFAHYPALTALGPDALSTEFTAAKLAQRLINTKKPIYSALLDQTVVAGLGNIYVNEALHAAKIHPLTPANQLTPQQLETLVSEAMRILNLALKFKGTTLIDNLYQDPGGATGEFYKMLQVYGKHKHPEIEVLKIGGRSVFVNKNTTRP